MFSSQTVDAAVAQSSERWIRGIPTVHAKWYEILDQDATIKKNVHYRLHRILVHGAARSKDCRTHWRNGNKTVIVDCKWPVFMLDALVTSGMVLHRDQYTPLFNQQHSVLADLNETLSLWKDKDNMVWQRMVFHYDVEQEPSFVAYKGFPEFAILQIPCGEGEDPHSEYCRMLQIITKVATTNLHLIAPGRA
jgi:hypothetical protein